MLLIIDPRLEDQYSLRAAQKACSLAYYCLSHNPKARPLMTDVVETLEPLQSSNSSFDVPLSFSSSSGSSSSYSDYRFVQTVGSGGGCRAINVNCSPATPTALRVR